MDLTTYIRDVPDFPKPGILFKDIMPLFRAPAALDYAVSQVAERWGGQADAVVALEARGFLFGPLVASKLKVPFAPVRKRGKLPGPVEGIEYALEYGTDEVEMQADAVPKGARILVFDDLLATGGTAQAACLLIEDRLGATVAGCAFLIELGYLNGRSRLMYPVQSLITYD